MLIACSVSGTVLGICTFIILILIVKTALCSGDSHLTEEDTEVQGRSVTCLMSHSYCEGWILNVDLLTSLSYAV